MFTFTNTEWLEASFQKRDCVKVIPSTRDSNRCCCGLPIPSHTIPLMVPVTDTLNRNHLLPNVGSVGSLDPMPGPHEHWNPARHTAAFPTDAYGCIDFRSGTQTNKAQYIRLSYDTRPELVLTLLLREWCLEKPKLLITVNGGKANFELQPKLKKSLRKGLLKAAKTTGAWIFTGGANTGVNKHVGDALVTEKSPRIKGGRVVSIGIVPWGIVEKRNELVGKKMDIPFHPVAQPRSKFVGLNKHHAYFLLVDNGTVGKYGAEIALRRKLEKFVSTQRLSANFCTPLVCLVIEGGTNTIRSVLEYVTDTPPVPVVVCDGTGRAADLLAFAHKYAGEDGEPGLLDDMHEQLEMTIEKTFNVNNELAKRLLLELLQCVKRKNLITVFRCGGERGDEELDQVIMTALFKAQHLSPVEQLSMALTWNRCDIAKKEIFTYGQEWPPNALENAMLEALENDRVDFVRLLLENGVNMNKFLTISRLEHLYNSRKGPANTLEFIVRDVVPRMPKNYQYTLIDIGLVINQLIGSGYRSSYSRRKFRLRYDYAQTRKQNNSPNKALRSVNNLLQKGLQKTNTENSLKVKLKIPTFSLPPASVGETPIHDEFLMSEVFDLPFSELVVWAVLTKRKEMAKLMWQNGEQAMSKALVASRLCQAMAAEAADDDLDVEIFDELTNFGKEFEELALQLLDYCYHLDDDLTQHLLTASLENWSRKTCLSLAIISHNLKFLAHPISQAILADLWMGGLRMRKNPVFKIIIGLFFPPSILKLEFKTREELELMPQTEEELQDRDENASNSSGSSSSSPSSSRRSSLHVGHPANFGGGSSFYDSDYGNGGSTDNVAFVNATTGGPSSSAHADKVYLRTRTHSNESRPEHSPLKEEMYWDSGNFQRMDTTVRKKTRPLKMKMKLYEFYAAPITKYYCHSVAYALFLGLYTYICLVRTPQEPSWPELYVMACMVAFGGEKVRTFLITESGSFSMRLKVWLFSMKWNLFDTVAIFFFMLAFSVRFEKGMIHYTHSIYATVVCYWYIRSLKLIGVNKYFGPYVMMIGKMIENMIYFVVLLLVVLMAFGVSRQGILYPNEEPDWRLVRHIFYQPYFMLYGEVFAPDIDPECNPDCEEYGECGMTQDGILLVPCNTGRWITPIIMTIYLLVANILLINLLIASFNTIYNKVSAMSQQLFNFQRFAIVMEYEEKPILPVPFTLISHVHIILKHIFRSIKGTTSKFESGLKLFLSKFDMERLYDFEEEGVEGLMRGKEEEAQQNITHKIKNLIDVSDELKSKLYDLERWETISQEATQNIDYRLQRLEEIAEQTSSQLSVIHRFMSVNVNDLGVAADNNIGGHSSRPGSSAKGQVAMEMRNIVSKSVSLSKQKSVSKDDLDEYPSSGPNDQPKQQSMSKQNTFESDPPEFIGDVPVSLNDSPLDETMIIFQASSSRLVPTIVTSLGNEPITVATAPDQMKNSAEGETEKVATTEPHLGPASLEATAAAAVVQMVKKKKKRVRHAAPRMRLITDSSEEDHLTKTGGLTKQQNVKSGDLETVIVPEEPNEVEEYGQSEYEREYKEEGDEYIDDDFQMPRHLRYKRAHSETGQASNSVSSMQLSRLMSENQGTSSVGDESDDGGSSYRMGRGFSLKARTRRVSSNHNYTSITDELECLIPAPMIPESPVSPSLPPAVQAESENLRDAEETDYILMESLIARRMRRDSHNLQNSLDDLVIKSIRDENSSTNLGTEQDLENIAGTETVMQEEEATVDTAPNAHDESGAFVADSGTQASSSGFVRRRDSSVRIRLNDGADMVEIEFVDENIQASSKL